MGRFGARLAADALHGIEERAQYARFGLCNMIFKIVALFLVFIGVLAWFGKMHWIGGKRLTQTQMHQLRTLPHRQGALRLRRKARMI